MENEENMSKTDSSPAPGGAERGLGGSSSMPPIVITPEPAQVHHHVHVPRPKRVTYQVIEFVFWVGSAFLLLRFGLKLLGANETNAFVKFIYDISQTSVGIFRGIVQDIHLTEAYVLEASTLIAWLVFWIIIAIAKKIFLMMTVPK